VTHYDNAQVLTDDRVPHPDLRALIWFDRDGEGPYTLSAIEKTISQSPRHGHDFHICGRLDLSYAILFPERLTYFKSQNEGK